MTARRRCKGENAQGEDCGAAPLKGSDFCLAHSDQETRASTGFGGPQEGSGRPRNPRAVDILRERLEQQADAVLNVLWDGLEADTHTVVGSGESAELEILPDHRVRLLAAKEILDRAYGRPKQATEVSGVGGDAIKVQAADMSDPAVRAWALDMVRERAGNVDD